MYIDTITRLTTLPISDDQVDLFAISKNKSLIEKSQTEKNVD